MTKEESRYFEAMGTLEYCYFALGKINEQLGIRQSPLEAMVDEATGYAKTRDEKIRASILSLLKEVVRCKKIMGEDTYNDTEAIKRLRSLK